MTRRPHVLALLLIGLTSCSSGTSSVAEPAPSSVSTSTTVVAAGPPTQFDCRDPIETASKPPSEFDVVGGIALQTSDSQRVAIGISPTHDPEPARRLFAKTGISIRSGVRTEIIVVPTPGRRVAVEWGNTDERRSATHLVIGPCRGAGAWLVFPGGYYVSDPTCVRLVIRSEDREYNRSVSVGTECPGVD